MQEFVKKMSFGDAIVRLIRISALKVSAVGKIILENWNFPLGGTHSSG